MKNEFEMKDLIVGSRKLNLDSHLVILFNNQPIKLKKKSPFFASVREANKALYSHIYKQFHNADVLHKGKNNIFEKEFNWLKENSTEETLRDCLNILSKKTVESLLEQKIFEIKKITEL